MTSVYCLEPKYQCLELISTKTEEVLLFFLSQSWDMNSDRRNGKNVKLLNACIHLREESEIESENYQVDKWLFLVSKTFQSLRTRIYCKQTWNARELVEDKKINNGIILTNSKSKPYQN